MMGLDGWIVDVFDSTVTNKLTGIFWEYPQARKLYLRSVSLDIGQKSTYKNY